MEEIVLNCEFITPAFIYGANNNPEIRAASIKGLMRFWWRASYGKFEDVEEMQKEESEIFGGIIKEKDKKETKYKAKVQIVTSYTAESNPKLNNKLEGYQYLFYTMNIGENKYKGYFKEGTQFDVKFIFKEENKEYVHEYLKSFNLLQLFGGIGSRSRRCGGNFVIKSISNNSIFTVNEIENNLYAEQWRNERNLNFYLKKVQEERKKIYVQYSNIISYESKCYIFNSGNKKESINLLNEIGEKYKSARCNINKALLSENRGKQINKYKQRGSSHLLIKILRDGQEYKVMIIKFAGKEKLDAHRKKDNKENKFVDVDENNVFNELIRICNSKMQLSNF